MSKVKTNFICQSCGAVHSKWQGKCSECNEWNSIIEETIVKDSKASLLNDSLEFYKLDNFIAPKERITTKLDELDRILGGGIVCGSAILIGGDPGIGKSTLLLQIVANIASDNYKCAYISGEESIDQIQLRAKRLNLHKSEIRLLSESNTSNIIHLLEKEDDLQLVVIDSIQTMFFSDISSAPGTVSQVKACSHEFIKFAKSKNVAIIFVGHVTKDGQLAGPKVLEHAVDAVLYFEGDKGQHFRILRAVKNRFGSINEIGVFEMKEMGLMEVTNPSELFLSPIERIISGSTVFAGIEGTRSILSEIQSLVAPSYLPTPRRSVVGWDLNRLSMIIAVLNSRYGMNLLNKEVYLNVAGGLKINEPAADLAVMVSIISTVLNKSLPPKTIAFGEVGLSGEVRKVVQAEQRLKEAKKLGFKCAIVPLETSSKIQDMKIIEIGHVKQLKDIFK